MNISFEYKSLIFGAVLGSSFFFGVQYFLGSIPESAIVFYFSALAVFMLLFLLSMIIMYFVNRSIKNNLEEISKRLKDKRS